MEFIIVVIRHNKASFPIKFLSDLERVAINMGNSQNLTPQFCRERQVGRLKIWHAFKRRANRYRQEQT